MKMFSQYYLAGKTNTSLRNIFSQITFPDQDIMLLYERAAHFLDSTQYGANAHDTIDTYKWYQMYKEVFYMAQDTNSFIPFYEITDDAYSYQADTITIALIDLDFYRIKEVAFYGQNYFISDTSNDWLLDNANAIASPYLERSTFTASPTKTSAYFRKVVFRIQPNFIIYDNNTAIDFQGINQLQIDFGDGNGFQNIITNTENFITIVYSTSGEKTIKTRIFDGETVHKLSVSRFGIETDALPPDLDNFWDMPGMRVGIFNSCPEHSQQKIIYLEGFDALDDIPSLNRGCVRIYNDMILDDELHYLRDLGYTYYVVDWKDSKIDMRFNALYLLNLIERLKGITDDSTQFVILGESMGGVIADFTLKFMESDDYVNRNFSPFLVEMNDYYNLPYILMHPFIPDLPNQYYDPTKQYQLHNTREFISMDSPLQGANMPIGIQEIYTNASEVLHFTTAFYSLFNPNRNNNYLDLKATRQLLIYHANVINPLPSNISLDYFPANDFNTFYSQLNAYPNLNFVKTVSISNGSLRGFRQSDGNGNQRNFNDLIFGMHSEASYDVLWIRFPVYEFDIQIRSNPNGVGNVLNTSLEWHFHLFSLANVLGYMFNSTALSILLSKDIIALNVLPYCVASGGSLNFTDEMAFDNINAQWHPLRLGTHGILGYDFQVNFDEYIPNFNFIPVESALKFQGGDPFCTDIYNQTIFNKIAATEADVFAGNPFLAINNANSGHLNTYNPSIFNLTNQQSNFTDPDLDENDYVYYSCLINDNFSSNRTWLSLEIGDEEIYLENFAINHEAKFRPEWDVKVNIRNPHYEYPSQPYIIGQPGIMPDGIYSNENPFETTPSGFAAFIFDINSPSNLPGFTMDEPQLSPNQFSLNNTPLDICCSNNARKAKPTIVTKSNKATLTIYPNPVNSDGDFRFEIENFPLVQPPTNVVVIDLFDVFGRKLMTQFNEVNIFDDKITSEFILSQTNIGSGIYIVRVSYNSETFQSKLIVQ
jgi:hypothetical protein